MQIEILFKVVEFKCSMYNFFFIQMYTEWFTTWPLESTTLSGRIKQRVLGKDKDQLTVDIKRLYSEYVYSCSVFPLLDYRCILSCFIAKDA